MWAVFTPIFSAIFRQFLQLSRIGLYALFPFCHIWIKWLVFSWYFFKKSKFDDYKERDEKSKVIGKPPIIDITSRNNHTYYNYYHCKYWIMYYLWLCSDYCLWQLLLCRTLLHVITLLTIVYFVCRLDLFFPLLLYYTE